MADEDLQALLLKALRQYVEESEFAQSFAVDQPDLAALFSDLAELKAEVKSESLQFKAALDTLSGAVDTLRTDNLALTNELTLVGERLGRQTFETQRAMLMEWLDVYDRLADGYMALQNYRPVDSLFNHSKKRDVRFIESLLQGQRLTLQRFELMLKRRKVYPMACVGKPFDPQTMNTIAIGSDPKFGQGIVLEELRKGFMLEDRVLRLAEVKVNKLES
ncbi:nucleotide exchange factor GrpE [Methylomonas sp. MgM2]